MESATIAAQGYRFRVPYGTLLCVSDKPLHGEIKLPGQANAFYERAIGQHLQIGIATMDLLRAGGRRACTRASCAASTSRRSGKGQSSPSPLGEGGRRRSRWWRDNRDVRLPLHRLLRKWSPSPFRRGICPGLGVQSRLRPATGAPMLSFKDITVRLGGRAIIENASAAIPPRARVGLIGRNGAGKSTLMKVIAGMLEPDAGSVDMPRGAKFGYIAQEAPGGPTSPFDTVLDADIERAALMRRRRPKPIPIASAKSTSGSTRSTPIPRRRAPHDPRRSRLRRRDAGAAARELFRRLADARGAGFAALLPARPAAARRAVEPPRSRSGAVARGFPARAIRRRSW